MGLSEFFANNLPTLSKGFELMAFGMGGIFIVLILLYVTIKILFKLFPVKPE